MNRPPSNRCYQCDRPVTIPGNNWAYIKEVKAHGNQPFAMMKTGKILGYAHQVCPDDEPDQDECDTAYG